VPYPPRRVVEKAHVVLPYDDLLETPTRSITYVVEGERLPPHPERDLLWFLIMYAPLEAWQRDVLQIMREESYYFYPQFTTKIMNEGWASYWHAELFHRYEGVSPEDMIEFARLHAGVVNPGGRYSINPYYLGYTIFTDIEKRWDQMHAASEPPPRTSWVSRSTGAPAAPSSPRLSVRSGGLVANASTRADGGGGPISVARLYRKQLEPYL
jgi:spore cortex formation protein SpoVR/YcgB (stage V sporulation)